MIKGAKKQKLLKKQGAFFKGKKKDKQKVIQNTEKIEKNKLTSMVEISKLDIKETIKLIEKIQVKISSEPQEYIHHLQTIFHFLESNNAIIVKVALFILTDIFKAIIPLYKIDLKSHKRKLEDRLQKFEKDLIQYEIKLIEFYEKFINSLKILSQVSISELVSKKDTQEQVQIKKQYVQKINQASIQQCLTLMESAHHFNFSELLFEISFKQILSNNQDIQDLVLQQILQLLKSSQPSTLEIKIKILKEISKIIQNISNEKKLPNSLIQIINQTNIDTNYVQKYQENEGKKKYYELKKAKAQYYQAKKKHEDDKKVQEKKRKIQELKKDKEKASEIENQRKEMKKLKKELKQDLEEGDAEMSKKDLTKYNSQILTQLFYVYFKILRKPQVSKYFKDVLEGVLQFIHLINMNLIQETIYMFQDLAVSLRKQKISYEILNYRLRTIFTIESILNGPGTLLEIDTKESLQFLFSLILDLIKLPLKELLQILDFSNQNIIIEILDIFFIKQRQYSNESVASYIKELSKLIINLSEKKEFHAFSSTIIFIFSKIFSKYSKTQVMFDEENEGLGLNKYNTAIEDVTSRNSLKTSIYEEFQILQQKLNYNETKQIIKRILQQQLQQPSISTIQTKNYYERAQKF